MARDETLETLRGSSLAFICNWITHWKYYHVYIFGTFIKFQCRILTYTIQPNEFVKHDKFEKIGYKQLESLRHRIVLSIFKNYFTWCIHSKKITFLIQNSTIFSAFFYIKKKVTLRKICSQSLRSVKKIRIRSVAFRHLIWKLMNNIFCFLSGSLNH